MINQKITSKEILSNRYEIIELVGVGGMSYVYKALDLKTKRIVAIKVLKDELVDDEDFLNKFRTEALASEKIHHKNVISSLDVVEENRLHYIVLEYADSITLNKYIKSKGHLTNEETIDFSIQIAQGLLSAHKQGIIHRDIKPQNILITKEKVAKITDFGIARAISSNTKNITVVGTIHYISPEQAKNESVDFRSDIYSLGCTMYEMITGKVPFDGENPASIIISHLRENIGLATNTNKDCFRSIEKIILKATKCLKSERYQNVEELIEDLKKASKDKSGSFINEDVYGSDDKTVIISDNELKMIKEWSQNFKSSDTISKESLNSKEQEFINNYVKNKAKLKSKYIWRIVLTITIAIAIVVGGNVAYYLIRTMRENNQSTIISTTSNVSENAILNNIKKSLVGIDLDVARNLLRDYNIRIDDVKFVYNDEFSKGQIIEVLGDEIKEDSTINVICSNGTEVIDFSDLEKLNSMDIADLEQQLDERNVHYEVVEIYDRYIKRGKVIAVNKPNSLSSDIIITVSKGTSDDVVKMPDLYNITLNEAEKILNDNNLALGEIYYQSNSEITEGNVVSQSVERNADIDVGTVINLTISSGTNGINTGMTPKEKWVGELKTVYIVANTNQPIVGQDTSNNIIIAIRLKQTALDGSIKYKELSQPTEYPLGTSISLVYLDIEGEPGVYTGEVQVVDVENDTLLRTFPIKFSQKME